LDRTRFTLRARTYLGLERPPPGVSPLAFWFSPAADSSRALLRSELAIGLFAVFVLLFGIFTSRIWLPVRIGEGVGLVVAAIPMTIRSARGLRRRHT
jgi:hypothetical protein